MVLICVFALKDEKDNSKCSRNLHLSLGQGIVLKYTEFMGYSRKLHGKMFANE